MHLRADFRPPQFGENFWHAGLAFGASFALFAALPEAGGPNTGNHAFRGKLNGCNSCVAL